MNRSRNFFHTIRRALIGLVAVATAFCIGNSYAQDGRATYEKTCSTCHAKGVAGAPQSDDGAAWQARLSKNGYSGLFDSALKGKGAMPPKGGNAALNEDEVMGAVMHMLRLAAAGSGSPMVAPPAKAAKVADVASTTASGGASSGASAKGRAVYQASCSACHATGAAGAPKLGDATAWGSRIATGTGALHNSALKGKGAMPAKGGNASLADADVKAAVDFMVSQGRAAPGTVAAATKPDTKKIPTATPAAPPAAATDTDAPGKSVYQATCAACHATGLAGAPKLGDQAAWAPRTKAGNATLYASALKGKGAMPAKGGNAGLSDDAIKGAVDFMVAQIGVATATKASPPVKSADASDAPQALAPAPARTAAAQQAPNASNVNSFNRLMQAPGKRNLPPLEDGIHDVANEATGLLQAPLTAYAGLPKSNAGNRIDWVKALAEKKLQPRADKQDPKVEMAVLEMNIVREVKGSMPDVVYPHRQHTQWLDCSNCHPAIFIPQKGANQISMASIILGQKCGVCHGKVAFPISECRLCHSKAKDAAAVSAGVKP